jgi:hypothetical protein
MGDALEAIFEAWANTIDRLDVLLQPRPDTQSTAFFGVLKQAGFFAQTVVIAGAGHFFIVDPVDETSFGGFAGPRALRFLKEYHSRRRSKQRARRCFSFM